MQTACARCRAMQMLARRRAMQVLQPVHGSRRRAQMLAPVQTACPRPRRSMQMLAPVQTAVGSRRAMQIMGSGEE